MRWIGWIGVWDAGRDLCGVDHLRHAQPYVPTATENGTAGRGDIHTNAIIRNSIEHIFLCEFVYGIDEGETAPCAMMRSIIEASRSPESGKRTLFRV